MKATAVQAVVQPTFAPITVTITLESPAEVQALYDVGNYSSQVAAHVKSHEGDANYDAMQAVAMRLRLALLPITGPIGHGNRRLEV